MYAQPGAPMMNAQPGPQVVVVEQPKTEVEVITPQPEFVKEDVIINED